jgi:hypothetical protein
MSTTNNKMKPKRELTNIVEDEEEDRATTYQPGNRMGN